MKDRVIFERKRNRVASHGHKGSSLSRRSTSTFPVGGGTLADVERFDTLVSGCRRMLLRITGVFPFDFFPDEVIIDECKVSVVFHEFFMSEDIHSVNIDMIKDVDVEAGPFFAQLQIVPDGYPPHPLIVRYLRKKDAALARSVIQGLMVVRKNNVDLAKIDAPDLVDKLELLGRTHAVSNSVSPEK